MLEFLIKDDFVQKEDKIAVGVSGGADSMVLLWALIDKQKQIGFELHVVNVNHHLRGGESDSDTNFVKEFCLKKKIACTIVDVDVKKTKTEQKLTVEESARKLRYEAFAKVMKKEKLNKLFLAHHKNDQVETILMHIFRGSGISGACGIKQSEQIVRPLLELSKNEILKIAKEYGVKFVEDSSNSDNDYSRNYIRNVVVPAIEKVYPNALNAIFEFGEKCKQVQNYLENQKNNDYFEEKHDCVVLKDQVLVEEKIVILEHVKEVFKKLNIFADIEQKHYEKIIELFNLKVNKSVDLPHGMVAKRTYAGVKFMKKSSEAKQTNEIEFVVGEVEFESYGKIKTSLVSASSVVYGEGSLFVDISKISNGAVWRTRKPGDVFSKLGTGSKKLNDYFTDKKVDFEKRDSLPILVSKNQVLVVAGLDVSENVKIDGETEQIVKIEFFPNWKSWQVLLVLLIL